MRFTRKVREALYEEFERQGSILQDATISMHGDNILVQGNLEINLRELAELLSRIIIAR